MTIAVRKSQLNPAHARTDTCKQKLTLLILAAIAAAGSLCRAEDSLPPLQDGKAPQNIAELWGGYDPNKEPLEVEILREWEKDGVVTRLVRYQVGTLKVLR